MRMNHYTSTSDASEGNTSDIAESLQSYAERTIKVAGGVNAILTQEQQ